MDHDRGNATARHYQTPPFDWRISETDRNVLERKVQEALTPSCPPLRMPTRHALTRYFQSYAEMFQKHFPLLHVATYSIEERSPALSLAIAAIGSQYRYEFANGAGLYRVAREITMSQIRNCPTCSSLPHEADTSDAGICGDLDHISTIILLMAYAQWMSGAELLPEALELQNPLAHAMRQDGLCEPVPIPVASDWRDWVKIESRRRAKFVGFVFLNVQTFVYNVPPQIYATEINLFLPCSSVEWAANTAETWTQLQRSRTPSLSFQEGLGSLIPNQTDVVTHFPGTSPFALFVLLHGILQKAILARQLQPVGSTTLRASDLDMLEYVHNCRPQAVTSLLTTP